MKKKGIFIISIIGCIVIALAIIIGNLTQPTKPKVDLQFLADYTDQQNSILYELYKVTNIDKETIKFTANKEIIGFLLWEKGKKPPKKIGFIYQKIEKLINSEIEIDPGDYEYVVFLNKIDTE